MCLVFSYVWYQDSPWTGRSFPKHDSICSGIAIYDSKVLGGMSGEVGTSTIIQGKQMLSDKTASSLSRSHSSLLNRTAETAASTVCLLMIRIKKMDSNILFSKMQRTVLEWFGALPDPRQLSPSFVNPCKSRKQGWWFFAFSKAKDSAEAN